MASGTIIGKILKDDVTFLTANWSSAVISAGVNSNAHIYAYKYHQLVLITGFIRVNSDIAMNTVIATVSGISAPREQFVSSASDGNLLGRMKLQTNGNITLESKLTKDNWYSFSFITYTST